MLLGQRKTYLLPRRILKLRTLPGPADPEAQNDPPPPGRANPQGWIGLHLGNLYRQKNAHQPGNIPGQIQSGPSLGILGTPLGIKHALANPPGLVFVTGRGGAGFHSQGPALTRGRGGIFRVIPAPPTPGAHPHSFPGRGPICYHPFLTGTRPGYGWGGGLSGDRGRECRKRHPAPGR